MNDQRRTARRQLEAAQRTKPASPTITVRLADAQAACGKDHPLLQSPQSAEYVTVPRGDYIDALKQVAGEKEPGKEPKEPEQSRNKPADSHK